MSDDRGSITPLILGYALIAMLLFTVIAGTSKVFLDRRELASLADGAAVYVADSIDESTYYKRNAQLEALPLRKAHVEAALTQYLSEVDAESEFGQLQPELTLDSTATTVTVRLTATVPVPFLNAVVPAGDGVKVTAVASARSPLAP